VHGLRRETDDNAFDQGAGDFTEVDPAAAALGLGTRLVVEDTPEGALLSAAPLFKPMLPQDVFGSLKVDGPPKTLEEMDAGVVAEARRRYARD